jgi:DNA-binding FadR family transcriptional regulator
MARNGRGTPTLERQSEEVRSIKEGEESTQHPKHQEVALKFSKNKFREALNTLFERNIAHSLVGDNTVILSSEHTTVFKPLNPKVSEVLSAGDLPPEEIAQLRREHLSFHDTDG